MSQRGGSVSSDVRFGPEVHSPMVPVGEAHFLLITESSQVQPNIHRLHPQGRLVTPDAAPQLFEDTDPQRLARAARMVNVALLGVLSAHLELPEPLWLEAIYSHLPERLQAMNTRAFRQARHVEMLFDSLTQQHATRPIHQGGSDA